MNFNVGDVVFDIKAFRFWDNIYSAEKYSKHYAKHVVKAANDRLFTIADIDLNKVNGFSTYEEQKVTFRQLDGLNYDSNFVQMVNLTTNKANILKYLEEKLFRPAFEECDKEDAKEIQRLEAIIAAAQYKLEQVKAGKRPVSFKADVIARDFLVHNRQVILDFIG